MAERLNARETNESPDRPDRLIPLMDVELVEKVKAGQIEAFGELVEKYQDRVFNAAWRICGHLEDARDITQDAFVKALENIGSFRQQSGFLTWVFRIAVNLALSHRRKQKRRAVSLEQIGVDTQADGLVRRIAQASEGDPAVSAGEGEVQSVVARALCAMDEQQRAVIVLRDIEGLDYREIGEILEIPPGTVRSRLHRARKALRHAVNPGLF